MKPLRLASIFLIFVCVSLAWAILGTSVTLRTQDSLSRLESQVTGLWGTPLVQQAPKLTIEETIQTKDAKGKIQQKIVSHNLAPDSSDLKIRLNSDARRKGLLWYRTYKVTFDGVYTVKHTFPKSPVLKTQFNFPSTEAIYDDFRFSVNDQEAAPTSGLESGIIKAVSLPPGKTATIRIHYTSRGKDNWGYTFGEGVTQVRNFRMLVDTDFHRFDFTPKSLSPSTKQETKDGWKLTWRFASLISGFNAGVEMPSQLNPGPIVSRITFFAPVGLLFFLAVVVILGMMRGRNIHPMHYFFVASGFFAFHLLLAYTADHLPLELTFLICALVSVILTVSYLIRAVGVGFALRVAAPAQLLFLILFSYAFFFEGYTGLSITIASILTLAILMHVTAKVDWEGRFGSGAREPISPTPVPSRPGDQSYTQYRPLE